MARVTGWLAFSGFEGKRSSSLLDGSRAYKNVFDFDLFLFAVAIMSLGLDELCLVLSLGGYHPFVS